jgi:elongation factor G
MARLKRKFGVEVNLLKPKIPYRETIRQGKVEVQGRYKRQTGGRGQFGDVWIRVDPLPRGSGFEFEDAIVGGVIPSGFIPSVEKGVKGAMEEGILAGYPVTDLRVTLFDGSHHPVDSSNMAFEIAGSLAIKKAVMEAKPVLLEPIMTVSVSVPDEFVGAATGDLNSRRGRIVRIDTGRGVQTITATVAQAELYKYSTQLRSLTQGRGTYSMEFSHYEEVPPDIAERIVAETKREKEEKD